ncbi:MAG TPA: histone deacetylase [Solirubrobacteraceae bacterium]|jgi:acetoin utilization deacetylase AcuC-like enzyme|nr:histone deacetylase [Solirubrobacteraceae bacterium]
MGRAVYLSHPASVGHVTGGHPERADRIRAVERELAARDWLGFDRRESPAVDRALVELVHTPAHVARIERLAAAGGGAVDLDTVVSPGSFEAAMRAAGGAVALVDELVDGTARTGFSAHRPPGHHATRERAMGFCLFNNVAVAARAALLRDGVDRVLIVDWDVHHGNGTNDIFHETDDVLYVSIHESPLYPGTGRATDRGSGRGTGFTVNLPVGPGSGDAVFCSLIDHVVCDLARGYAPQLVLISAGYDAHLEDPLADCSVTDGGYAAMTTTMRRLSEELGAPLGVVLEGGYALGALARSVAATMDVMAGVDAPPAVEVGLHPVAGAARARLGLDG